MLKNGLLDNSKPALEMVASLREIVRNPSCDSICIATGYWDLPGTNLLLDELRGFFSRGGKMRILIGEEPHLFPYQLKEKPQGEPFPDFFIKQDLEKLSDEFASVGQLVADNLASVRDGEAPLQIRIYGRDGDAHDQFLHAKCYILTGRDLAYAIMGSSNFTQKGLEGNAELNKLETDAALVAAAAIPGQSNAKSYRMWFDEKWNESRPWSGKFISILKGTKLGKKISFKPTAPTSPTEPEPPLSEPFSVSEPLTPYELYVKLLQYRFADILDANVTEEIKAALPAGYKPLEYQIDAVKQCYAILKKHGGFLLGDVVGLGKTIVGALVIRRFLDSPGSRERRILIVTPPAVKPAWQKTIGEFDADKGDKMAPNVDFVTIGSIANLIDDADDADDESADTGAFEESLQNANYGLILVDESHRFRNAQTAMYQALDDLIAQIGMSGHDYPYVGLLSATPQNNSPDDLKNQIYLFQRDRKCSTLENVPGKNLEAFFVSVSKRYKDLLKELKKLKDTTASAADEAAVKKEIKKLAADVRDSVLCDLLVRRTRTDVKKFYADDIAAQGLVFPKIVGPNELKYELDADLAKLFADTMELLVPTGSFKFDDASFLCYWRYQAVRFLAKDSDRKKYQFKNLDVERFSRQLATMTQQNLVKRLESSFSAFRRSLHNLCDNTQKMMQMWQDDVIFICPQIDVMSELDPMKLQKKGKGAVLSLDQCYDDVRAKIKQLTDLGQNEKNRNHEYTRDDFKAIDGKSYLECLKCDYAILKDLCDRWDKCATNDPKLDVFKASLGKTLMDKKTNTSQRLVIFSESIDTVDAICQAAEHGGYKGKVLRVTAQNRKDAEQKIRENFDANYEGAQKDDYRILVTTEVLAEGVNLHRANVILNYDTPWNATRLMQRIGRVNRIGSTAKAVYVYNFMPSAQGDAMIKLVETAYTKLQMFHSLFGEDSKVFTEDEEIASFGLSKFVDGEESPDEKYKTELKQFKSAHPERYAQILARETGLFGAAATNGVRYFVVEEAYEDAPAKKHANGLPVCFDPAGGKAQIVSYAKLLSDSRPDPAAPLVPLPDDWNDCCKAVRQAAVQYLAQLKTTAKENVLIAAAKKAVHGILQKYKPADGSKLDKALSTAYDGIAGDGNLDYAKHILALWHKVQNEDGLLLKVTEDEIAHAVEKMIGSASDVSAKKKTTLSIYWGLVK